VLKQMSGKVVLYGFLLALAGSGAAAIAAKSLSLGALNERIVELLRTVNSQPDTTMSIEFTQIEIDPVRVLAAAVKGRLQTKGAHNTLDLNVREFSYTFGDGNAPTSSLKGYAAIDLSKLATQEQFNHIIADFDRFSEDYIKDATRQYGDAINISIEVTERARNAAGDYSGFRVSLRLALDLSKLPESKKKEMEPFLSAQADVRIQFKQGIFFEGQVVSNPVYQGFQKDREGLKEYLEKLLNQDSRVMQELQSYAETIYGIAHQLVETAPESEPKN
jgi:hypothetical protein